MYIYNKKSPQRDFLCKPLQKGEDKTILQMTRSFCVPLDQRE
jgi:hypothetical protein